MNNTKPYTHLNTYMNDNSNYNNGLSYSNDFILKVKDNNINPNNTNIFFQSIIKPFLKKIRPI